MKKQYTCICGKEMKETELEFEGFIVKARKCDNCGEELIDPLGVEKIRTMKSI